MKVTIKSSVFITPCDIQIAPSAINFGKLYVKNFIKSGSTSFWKKIDVHLSNCPKTASTIAVNFDGIPDESFANYYKNTGNAKNAALELRDENRQKLLPVKSELSVPISKTQEADFLLFARIISPQGKMEFGNFEAQIQFNLSYQ